MIMKVLITAAHGGSLSMRYRRLAWECLGCGNIHRLVENIPKTTIKEKNILGAIIINDC